MSDQEPQAQIDQDVIERIARAVARKRYHRDQGQISDAMFAQFWNWLPEQDRNDYRHDARVTLELVSEKPTGLLPSSLLPSAYADMSRELEEAFANPARARLISVRAVDGESKIAQVLTLHRPQRVYDKCGHEHTEAERDAGKAVEVEEVGLTCDDGYQCSICTECCMENGYQTEDCANDHNWHLDPDGYVCNTRRLLETGKLPGEK